MDALVRKADFFNCLNSGGEEIEKTDFDLPEACHLRAYC